MTNEQIKINLNTGEDGIVSFKTRKIVGMLNSVILTTSDPTEVMIESSLGYRILHRFNHFGTEYLAPRTRVTAPNPMLRDVTFFDKFALNEQLIINARGQPNKEVEIIIRID